ncbi:DUF933 domain-containing protein, partial [bacterium]|nr:DUF933 domain-containing protein [bacterium]
MLRIGIIGPQGCGKTTLLQALAPAVKVDGGTRREIHIGQAKVQDARLDHLYHIFGRSKKVNAIVEYVDVAGYQRGEAKTSGYDPQLLVEIRSCDALLHLLRGFDTPGLPDADPLAGYETDFAEFLISDQIIVEHRIERLEKEISKKPSPDLKREYQIMQRCQAALLEEQPLRTLDFSAEEEKILRAFQLLSLKPELVVINIAEEDIARSKDIVSEFRQTIQHPGVEVSVACATIEMEIAQLDEASAREFMDDLGIRESALNRLIRASYKLLGLISFFTIGDDECRAWTIRNGAIARAAAGEVHS